MATAGGYAPPAPEMETTLAERSSRGTSLSQDLILGGAHAILKLIVAAFLTATALSLLGLMVASPNSHADANRAPEPSLSPTADRCVPFDPCA